MEIVSLKLLAAAAAVAAGVWRYLRGRRAAIPEAALVEIGAAAAKVIEARAGIDPAALWSTWRELVTDTLTVAGMPADDRRLNVAARGALPVLLRILADRAGAAADRMERATGGAK